MKAVYVVFDPLCKKIICVHDEPNIECEICYPVRNDGNDRLNHPLQESKHEIHSKLNSINISEKMNVEAFTAEAINHHLPRFTNT